MAAEKKNVTRKPSWSTGIILPSIAGMVFGFVLPSSSSVIGWYIFAGWQVTCGFAVVQKLSPIYERSSYPQGKRLCESYAMQWIFLGIMTAFAGKELPALKEKGEATFASLPVVVLLSAIICNFGFSVLAGPIRLTNASSNDMFLVPTNSFLVATLFSSLLKFVMGL